MAGMTIKDIAKKCHVGVSTVSRAMNNHPDINPETKEKILKAIEEANYVPNNSARNLKRNDAKAIAVLVKGIGNTFFSELVGILERECEKKGYSCILQYVDEQEDEWDVAIRVGKEKIDRFFKRRNAGNALRLRQGQGKEHRRKSGLERIDCLYAGTLPCLRRNHERKGVKNAENR